MTREKWAVMSRHTQELYLAVLLGYTSVAKGTADCPHFCIDLNVMHEAEKKLNRYQRTEFRRHLGSMFPRDEDGDSTGWEGRFGRAILSTAAQRAEAPALTLEPEE